VVHTNDLHSHFDPVGPSSSGRLGGFPALATLIREAQARADARGAVRLTVDGGDWMMGSLYQALQGTVETDFLRYTRYDAVALGEHDLDWGAAGLVSFLTKDVGTAPILSAVLFQQLGCSPGGGGCPALSPVPVVTSGLVFDGASAADDALEVLYDPDDGAATTSKPLNRFVIIERRGVRVGIFGLLGRAASDTLATAGPPFFADPVDTARDMVALLRGPDHDVDVVVALSHSGSLPAPYRDEDEALALEVDGIDLIVSAHTERVVAPKRVGGTWIVQAGRFGEHLGELELAIPTVPWAAAHGHLDPEIARWTLHDVAGGTPKDAILSAARTAYLSQVNAAFLGAGLTYDTTLGAIASTISRESGVESPVGDLIADAVRAGVDARVSGSGDSRPIDVALVPNAIVRGELRAAPGASTSPVTFGDAFSVVPLGASPTDATSLGYPLVSFYVSGDELRQALEVATTLYELRGDDFWLSVSGIKWTWSPARPAFHRVTGIWLDPGGTATVCASSTNLLDATGAVKDTARLYRIATDLYTAGFMAQLSEISGGLLAIAAKDVGGAPVSPLDRIVPESGGGQARAWRVFVERLGGLAAANGGIITPPSGGRVLTATEQSAVCGR
ncbi:MAG: bifunctional metallophosphatase/5'-nucleotidase, partial [Myxococcales bacterium]|nr:bifunctional metallophosphatase/5'-nucleotidase [Myxococcales bacterium]